MKTIKENFGTLVICALEIIVGILLFIDPESFTAWIIEALGILFLIMGLVSIIGYFRKAPKIAAAGQGMAKGLIGIAAGLFCILKNSAVIKIFAMLTLIYGVGILLLGIYKIQLTFDLLRIKKRWGLAALSSLITVCFALLIIVNPFTSTKVLWIFIAITLIFEAVLDIVSVFVSDTVKRTPSQQ